MGEDNVLFFFSLGWESGILWPYLAHAFSVKVFSSVPFVETLRSKLGFLSPLRML